MRVAEEAHAVLGQERPPWARAGELGRGAGKIEHVGRAHGVEHAGRLVRWRAQVRPAAEVQQPHVVARIDGSADEWDGQRALAAEHEGDAVVLEDGGDAAPAGREHVHHPAQVVRQPFVRVGSPANAAQVPVVGQVVSGAPQQADEPGVPQRAGRLLQARPVRGGAGRHPQQTKSSHGLVIVVAVAGSQTSGSGAQAR